MKYEYINSINDIDASKISIRDINKRYIDRYGNRFAVRFKPGTRKVEIVRLVSTKKEAMEIRKQILKEKQQNRLKQEAEKTDPYADTPVIKESIDYDRAEAFASATQDEQPTDSNYMYDEQGARYNMSLIDPYADDDFNDTAVSRSEGDGRRETAEERDVPRIEKNPFYESQFTEETSQHLNKIKDRLFAIANNLKRSRLFESYKGDEFFEITRQLDSEGINGAEEAVNLYKEISHYPRPLTYYLSRMNEAQKRHIESIEADDKRMEVVKRWELQEAFETVYRRIMNLTVELLRILDEIPEQYTTNLPAQQRTYLTNARTSAELVVEDCNKKLARIEIWKRKHPG